MISWLTVGIDSAIALGGYVILWAYGWRNPWWLPQPGWAPVGRAIMGLGAIIAVFYTYAAVLRALNTRAPVWLSLLIGLLVLVVVWMLATAFARNRYLYYRRRGRHAVDRGADPVEH